MRCHYAVLGVARGATEDDIRKAYRRLVIALHPDKAQQRGEDPQKATEAFREVQAAYECLYDEQERAYYDANREAILRGDYVSTRLVPAALGPWNSRYSPMLDHLVEAGIITRMEVIEWEKTGRWGSTPQGYYSAVMDARREAEQMWRATVGPGVALGSGDQEKGRRGTTT